MRCGFFWHTDKSEIGLDLLDHFGVLLVSQIGLTGIHGEDAAVYGSEFGGNGVDIKFRKVCFQKLDQVIIAKFKKNASTVKCRVYR